MPLYAFFTQGLRHTGRQMDILVSIQEQDGNHTTQQDTGDKYQVPDFLSPFITKKRNAGRQTGGADMAKRRRDAEWLVTGQ